MRWRPASFLPSSNKRVAKQDCKTFSGTGWVVVEKEGVTAAERCACVAESQSENAENALQIPANYRAPSLSGHAQARTVVGECAGHREDSFRLSLPCGVFSRAGTKAFSSTIRTCLNATAQATTKRLEPAAGKPTAMRWRRKCCCSTI